MIYYGPSDGGPTAAAWAQRILLGGQEGSFSQTVGGLSPNTVYYFRAVAISAAGTAWASSSQVFNTATVSPSTVTNLPASSVGPNVAVLSGEVLATGGDAPVVTLYYGPTNGGTTAGAWAQSLVLPGVQNGRFDQLVSGLTTNTTYYFTVEAVNAAGVAWGTPVQSFSTLAAGDNRAGADPFVRSASS